MKLLFEKLATSGEEFDLTRAVLSNVQRLAGTRVTTVDESVPTFDVLSCGLTSIVELGSHAHRAIERHAARLRALLEHYEPRLHQPSVQLQGMDGAVPVSVTVCGTLYSENGPQPVRFPLSGPAL